MTEGQYRVGYWDRENREVVVTGAMKLPEARKFAQRIATETRHGAEILKVVANKQPEVLV